MSVLASAILKHVRLSRCMHVYGTCSASQSLTNTGGHDDGNFLLLRPYHGEHGPKVPVTPEYIVLQRVLRKRECMTILTRMIMHLIG
jgi:hypothetical protein